MRSYQGIGECVSFDPPKNILTTAILVRDPYSGGFCVLCHAGATFDAYRRDHPTTSPAVVIL